MPMQVTRIIQAAILMVMIALAASCSSSKEFIGKIFPAKDTTSYTPHLAIKQPRFLQINNSELDSTGWIRSKPYSANDTIINTSVNIVQKAAPVTIVDSSNKMPSKKEMAPVEVFNKPNTVRSKKIRD
ncbi:MAG: hypothetical protein RL115_1527 [Bacteroidota bacterium]|jgi:hypothetical protein